METRLLAQKLKTLRTGKGLTQEQVAGDLYVTRQTVSKWETGVNDPDLATIVRLCDLYQVTLDFLLRDDAVLIDKLARKERSHRKLVLGIVALSVALFLILAVIGFSSAG